MFSSFHLKSKMDPPAAATTDNNTTNSTNTPWEMTNAPVSVLIDGKLTYENVKEDDHNEHENETVFRFGNSNATNDDLEESRTVFQETKMQMEASTDSMPALVAPRPSTTRAPDSPVSVPSIELSVKASDIDMDMDDLSLSDLVSPPSTPVPVRENKRPRMHVETVTDDEDGGDYMDRDDDGKKEYALEYHPAAAHLTADPLVPQVVVTNMFEAAAAALPTETAPPAADADAPDDSTKRVWSSWDLIGAGLFVVSFIAVIMRIPSATPSTAASMSHGSMSEQVLVPVTTPSTAVTLVVEQPDALFTLDEVDAQQEKEEEVESESMPELLAEVIVAMEDILDLDAMFDLETMVFNSTSMLLVLEEEEEELAPTEAVLTLVAPEAPAVVILVAEEIIQELIQEATVLEPPAAKEQSSLYNYIGILAAMFLGMSCINRKQESSRPGQVKGMLKNHAELARFLEGASTIKKAGRKCRSPAKFRSSSDNKDNINSNSNYDGFTVEDLKMLLDNFNGRKLGNKADLIHALVRCYRETLSGFKNIQLQELLAIKGLHQSGKKQEMADRLVEAGF